MDYPNKFFKIIIAIVLTSVLSVGVLSPSALAAYVANKAGSSNGNLDIFQYMDSFEINVNKEIGSFDGVTAKASRIIIDNSFHGEGSTYGLEVVLENEGKNTYSINNASVCINGYTMNCGVYESIRAGKKATIIMDIDQYMLSYVGVEEINCFDVHLELSDDNYDKVADIDATISLKQPIKIEQRMPESLVLWEDDCIKITLLGISSGETQYNGKTYKRMVFTILKENYTTRDDLSFAVQYKDHYVNDEATDAYEYCCLTIPAAGKEISSISMHEIPNVDERRTIELSVVGEYDLYHEFLKGDYVIKTNEDDEIVEASGLFEQQDYYGTYIDFERTEQNSIPTSDSAEAFVSISEDGNTLIYISPSSGKEYQFSRDSECNDCFEVMLDKISDVLYPKVGIINWENLYALHFENTIENCGGIKLRYAVEPDVNGTMDGTTWAIAFLEGEKLDIVGANEISMKYGNLNNPKNDIIATFEEPINIDAIVIAPLDNDGGFFVNYGLDSLLFQNEDYLVAYLFSIDL